MKLKSTAWLCAIVGIGTLASVPLVSRAEPSSGGSAKVTADKRGEDAVVAERSDNLTNQDREALQWANQLAREASQAMEGWISSGSISDERLFARLYFPVPDSDPPKFNTPYDALADRDFPGIQEKYLSKSSAMVYAFASDNNGYVPTHNQQFAQPLTGNRAVDLVNNRTKRIFGDVTGFNAARSQAPYLVQTYKRDTGEVMKDLSVPLRVKGVVWGCIRLGYRQVDK